MRVFALSIHSKTLKAWPDSRPDIAAFRLCPKSNSFAQPRVAEQPGLFFEVSTFVTHSLNGSRRLALASLIILASACSNSSSSSNSGAPIPAPTGTTLSVGGGQATTSIAALNGTTVDVPTGAVAANTVFDISQGQDIVLTNTVTVGPAVRVDAGGTTLASPATVTIPYDPSSIPGGSSATDIFVIKRNDTNNEVIRLPITNLDTVNNRVSVDATEFSTFQALVPMGGVGTAARLSFSVAPAANTNVGATVSPSVQVTVQDIAGNAVTSNQVMVSLRLENANGAVLSGGQAVMTSGGVATFNGLSINQVGSQFSLVATTNSLIAVRSNRFQIDAVDQTAIDVFTAFPTVSSGVTGAQSLVIPNINGLFNRAFLSYSNGADPQLVVLNVNGAAVSSIATVTLESGTNPAKVAGPVTIHSASLGSVVASDSNTGANPVIYFFNPATVSTSNDITKLDLSGLQVITANGRGTAQGMTVNGPYGVTFPTNAVVIGSKLILAFANFTSTFDTQPGAVFIFDLSVDLANNSAAVSNGQEILTNNFNPIALTALDQAVAVTVEGSNDASFAELPSSLEFVSLGTNRLVSVVPLGTTSAQGALAVSADLQKGYLNTRQNGSVVNVHELDLSDLASVLSNQGPQTQASRLLNTYSISVNANTFNSPNTPVLSFSSVYLHVLLDANKELITLDLSTGATVQRTDLVSGNRQATSSAGMNGFVDNNFYLARRADDSTGRLYIGTSNLSSGARTDPNVPTALDTAVPAFK